MSLRVDPSAVPYLKPHIVPEARKMKCFTGQLADEVAILYIRRHWIIDAVLFVRMVFWLAFPVLVYQLVNEYVPQALDNGREELSLAVISVWMLFVGLNYYINWLDAYLDVVVVTDRRIVDIDQNRLFNRSTSEASLVQIQDVTADVRGILATLLRYGDLMVQTAGERAHIAHPTIGHPTTVATQILKIRDDYLAQKSGPGAFEARAEAKNEL